MTVADCMSIPLESRSFFVSVKFSPVLVASGSCKILSGGTPSSMARCVKWTASPRGKTSTVVGGVSSGEDDQREQPSVVEVGGVLCDADVVATETDRDVGGSQLVAELVVVPQRLSVSHNLLVGHYVSLASRMCTARRIGMPGGPRWRTQRGDLSPCGRCAP